MSFTTQSEARVAINQILEGITYCHAKVLPHGNLTLNNILWVPKGPPGQQFVVSDVGFGDLDRATGVRSITTFNQFIYLYFTQYYIFFFLKKKSKLDLDNVTVCFFQFLYFW